MSTLHADVVVGAALALDLVFGDPTSLLHPVAWIGRLIDWGRARLLGGSPARLLASGALLTFAVAGFAAAMGWAISDLGHRLGVAGLALEAVALKLTLSPRGLIVAARAVGADLARGDVTAARAAVGRHLVSRPTAALDTRQVASATIESVAENLTDALVAPVCFFLVFGLPGAAVYRAVNTADTMIGYRGGALEYFGKLAARLDDALSFLPARLGGWALVMGAGFVGERARAAASVMGRDHARTASPNAGWTMAAMAGALGVVLEKPGAYRLGDGALPGPGDIERAIRVARAAATVAVVVALGANMVARLAR